MPGQPHAWLVHGEAEGANALRDALRARAPKPTSRAPGSGSDRSGRLNLSALINARPHEVRGAVASVPVRVLHVLRLHDPASDPRDDGHHVGRQHAAGAVLGNVHRDDALQPVYGWLTSRFRRTTFLPWVYLFFIANILGFYAWFNSQADHTWIARAYFIWVSVFNLFVVAVFWSLMADVFTPRAGGTAVRLHRGGPERRRALRAVPRSAARGARSARSTCCRSRRARSRVSLLLLRRDRAGTVRTAKTRAAGADRDAKLGGSSLAAFGQVLRSPYLALIALFVFLLTWVSTFLYLEQQALVAAVLHAIPTRRRSSSTRVDFWVQAGSLVTQVFLFGRLFRLFGFRALIVSVPLLMTLGYVALALVPAFAVLVGRAGDPAHRRVRDHAAVTRRALHGRDARGALQGQEPDRHARSIAAATRRPRRRTR